MIGRLLGFAKPLRAPVRHDCARRFRTFVEDEHERTSDLHAGRGKLIHGSGDSQLVTSLVAGAIGCTLIQIENIARDHSEIIVKLMVAMIKDADGRLWYRAG